MKRLLFILITALCVGSELKALPYDQARQEAWFLTDKMAYELNLTSDQFDRAYQVNLDYFLSIGSAADCYGYYWTYRDNDLRYILFDWQYTLYTTLDYFFRPVRWLRSVWYFPIFDHYRRGYYYFDRPLAYVSYRGVGWRRRGHNDLSPFAGYSPRPGGGLRDRYHAGGAPPRHSEVGGIGRNDRPGFGNNGRPGNGRDNTGGFGQGHNNNNRPGYGNGKGNGRDNGYGQGNSNNRPGNGNGNVGGRDNRNDNAGGFGQGNSGNRPSNGNNNGSGFGQGNSSSGRGSTTTRPSRGGIGTGAGTYTNPGRGNSSGSVGRGTSTSRPSRSSVGSGRSNFGSGRSNFGSGRSTTTRSQSAPSRSSSSSSSRSGGR